MTVSESDDRPVLLLTASVTPDPRVPNLRITDPGERSAEYLRGLRRAIEQSTGLLRGVVLAENTGADLSAFKAAAHGRPDVELLAVPPTPEFAGLGRGYLETRLVAEAFELSRLLSPPDSYAWKLTGRYQVANLPAIVGASVRADLNVNLRRYPQKWADMWFYGLDRRGLDVLTDHLNELREDVSSQPSETVLFDILLAEHRAGRDIGVRLPVEPRMIGRRGFDATSYAGARQRLKWTTRAAARRFAPRLWI